MARIAGVDLPREKRVEIGLTYVFGIGRKTSNEILAKTGINPDTRVKDLTEEEAAKLREVIERDYNVEGDLRREIGLNIKRLVEIGWYRGPPPPPGQPATPTTLGKELAVYVYRLNRQLKHIENQEYLGKINGATGTFGAHLAACPDVDWIAVSREFVTNRMGLTWNPLTTQIESHDWQAELYSTVSHANRIMHNLCVDVWMYISRGVFAQVPVKGATGSSTMPHKVNPIRFENAEANFEISCSLLDTLSATLVESRWQRDLTDSTTQRNIGSALGYSLLALTNLMGGLESIHPNTHVIERELDENWEVLGEPIQTAMRACELKGLPGMDKPYEKVKELMRGHEISKEAVEQFIDQQAFDDATTARLKALTPATYTGVASKLVDFDR